ncbi:MAG: ligand-binding protein SH3 [Thermoplasmata archaeon]|nr:MAG: ligand-binding protein SH3 [Thermoplasmata archaeon]
MQIIEGLLSLLSSLPPWLVVFLISMIPFVELRGAIPVAILIYHMPVLTAYIIAVIGNMVPVIPILIFLGSVEKWLRKYEIWARAMDKLFDKTRRRASRSVERYEEVGIMLFVAIPLPMTGAWTGSLIAYLFGLEIKKSTFVILLGVLIAGLVVTAATLGAIMI